MATRRIEHALKTSDVLGFIIGSELETVLDLLPQRNVPALLILRCTLSIQFRCHVVFEQVFTKLGPFMRLKLKGLRLGHSLSLRLESACSGFLVLEEL